VTEASSDQSADFQSRFFAPRIGINEDPVTGSAHCGLGPHWSSILGKKKLTGYQSTSTRGGFVGIDLNESQPGRVLLKCQGVVVSHAMLTL
jgi:predicted PhzF superfamily epimerase YddE/YHI9